MLSYARDKPHGRTTLECTAAAYSSHTKLYHYLEGFGLLIYHLLGKGCWAASASKLSEAAGQHAIGIRQIPWENNF